ncbi:hypothetical protein EDB19DRAFT_1830040 [Suillus lakei]|nr:hypothetical protein EDB19DRAFT_1830040 [Suillus lakei]
MLNHLRTLHQAVDEFLDDNNQRAISHLKLEPVEWQILQDLEVVLEAPHAVQQSMSSKSTPVLSCAIPAFESLTWTDKYHEWMSHMGAYGVAMFVDPAIHMSWMNDNWDMMQKKRMRDTSDSTLSTPLEQSDHQTHAAATLGLMIYGLSDIDILLHNEPKW